MPGPTTNSRDNAGHTQAALRDLLLQFNKHIIDTENLRLALVGDVVTTATVLSRGSTDTNLASTAFTFSIGGVPALKAVVAAGTALGALGTIPQDTWGIIAAEIVAAGTVSFLSGAANYTTGYATEALAIAALPVRVTAKARMGYITILTKAATAFVVGTDALAGGATGNPATTTNYYPRAGVLAATGVNANGMNIPTVLLIGSTDTNLGSTACTFNIAGAPFAKAAVAAGTAFGALGTVPADTFACIAADIIGAGTITFASASQNYTTGYGTEVAAIRDLPAVVATKARLGYITLKTKAATAFVVGTDALAGGATGNPASATTYYPASGITLGAGLTAAQIGNESAVAFTT